MECLTFERLFCLFSECLLRVTLVPKFQSRKKEKNNPNQKANNQTTPPPPPKKNHGEEPEKGPRWLVKGAESRRAGSCPVPVLRPRPLGAGGPSSGVATCLALLLAEAAPSQRTGGLTDVSRPISRMTPFRQQRELSLSLLFSFAARNLRATLMLNFLTYFKFRVDLTST